MKKRKVAKLYPVNAEIFVGDSNFLGEASPQKLNPQKFVHKELATVITLG